MTDSPRIAVAIQHVPSRAALLPGLAASLGGRVPDGGSVADVIVDAADWAGVLVCTGDEELRNPWETYRGCLRTTELWQPGEATHLLVMQDDALPVERFHERLAPLVAGRANDVLCLYVPQHPPYMGRAIHAAYGKGEAYAELPNGMFCPLVAAVWPLALVQDVLGWWQARPNRRPRRCDDALVAEWLRSRKRAAFGVVPSLVEHDEMVRSTLGLSRYKRTAAIMASQK